MGSSPSWQPGSDNCGPAADTTLDRHHHAGNDNHDDDRQPHTREPQRGTTDFAEEKWNNQVAKRAGVNNGVDASYVQLAVQPEVPSDLTTGLQQLKSEQSRIDSEHSIQLFPVDLSWIIS